MTTIYYTVPSDGDDLAHPNVYKIPNISPKELTLATVAQVRSPHETRDVRHVFIDVFFLIAYRRFLFLEIGIFVSSSTIEIHMYG